MPVSKPSSFPQTFTWGAAAASYQIEGAASEDGKGPGVWDMMCRLPGRIWEGQNGDIACDHYHRYAEDVALMKSIGLQAYRLSLSWPRIMPEGTGAVNPKGLDFYDRLVDELLAAGVQPWVTLFHWDLPLALYYRGHWLNPDMPQWFADYTRVVVDKLSDRVSHWMTLNEPQCFIGLALQLGKHAPGDKLGLPEILRAGHGALLSHGRAVQVIRAHAKIPSQIGWAPVGVSTIPASEDPADVEAARQSMFSISSDHTIVNPWDQTDVWNNTWWGDPVVFGHYPEDGLATYGKAVPAIGPDDMKIISQPIDFYGANTYNGSTMRAGPDGRPQKVPKPEGSPITALKWGVTPECLYWTPKFLHERYKLPIVITENGMSGADWVSLDGKVHDPQRVDFLHRYLLSLDRAVRDGVDVRGYFLWSIMDNFEWAEGFKERFGIIHVDYATQKRTLKDSAHWYRQVIATNGGSLHDCLVSLDKPKNAI